MNAVPFNARFATRSAELVLVVRAVNVTVRLDGPPDKILADSQLEYELKPVIDHVPPTHPDGAAAIVSTSSDPISDAIAIFPVGVNVHVGGVAPAWVTETDCPLTVILPVRLLVLEFACRVTVTYVKALPDPDIGLTFVIQLGEPELDAVQEPSEHGEFAADTEAAV